MLKLVNLAFDEINLLILPLTVLKSTLEWLTLEYECFFVINCCLPSQPEILLQPEIDKIQTNIQ